MKWIVLGVVLIVLAGVAGLFYLGQKSATGSAPGLSGGKLAACPSSPNCVSSEDGALQAQRVDPLPLDAWSKLPAVVEAMGGSVARQERSYIAAEFTSRLFKFTDDVEFRLAGDAVHVRSASRVGHSDMGANRDRVQALRERLAAR